MNAKEWLEKEGLYNSNNITLSDRLKPEKYFNLDDILDRYAIYKINKLKSKVKEFELILRQEKNASMSTLMERHKINNLLELYQEHFNLKNES